MPDKKHVCLKEKSIEFTLFKNISVMNTLKAIELRDEFMACELYLNKAVAKSVSAKWNKPVTKGQILYDSTYMRYLEQSNS